MKKLQSLAVAGLMSLAAVAANATTTTIGSSNVGTWQAFDVTDVLSQSGGTEWVDISDGSALSFSFTVAAGTVGHLTVVDGGFAGDTFTVTANGALLGNTSSVPVVDYASNPADLNLNFDAALANPAYSRGTWDLAAGSYTITGALLQSVTGGGAPLNSTVGGLMLTVSAVPLPPAAALMLAGLGLVGAAVRRRAI